LSPASEPWVQANVNQIVTPGNHDATALHATVGIALEDIAGQADISGHEGAARLLVQAIDLVMGYGPWSTIFNLVDSSDQVGAIAVSIMHDDDIGLRSEDSCHHSFGLDPRISLVVGCHHGQTERCKSG